MTFASSKDKLAHLLASLCPEESIPEPVSAAVSAAGSSSCSGPAGSLCLTNNAAELVAVGGNSCTSSGGGPMRNSAELVPAGSSSNGPASVIGGDGFALKHGVRLLRRRLDLQMVLPLLLANPVTALDLEGQLDPHLNAAGQKAITGDGADAGMEGGGGEKEGGEGERGEAEVGSGAFGVDLVQVYVPSVDLVLLIYTPDITVAAVARILGPWLTSPAHAKVRAPLTFNIHLSTHKVTVGVIARILIARILGPWLTSPAHAKVRAPSLAQSSFTHPSCNLLCNICIHTPDITVAAVARILGPWLTSPAHAKVRAPPFLWSCI
jgi:hypothetical protein